MVKQYMHAGDILRNRKDYQVGLSKLQAWLRNAESILSSSQLGSAQNIKAYGEKLQQLQHEMEGTEDLFKNVSKKFQELISDLSREEVDRMMATLKKEKGAQNKYLRRLYWYAKSSKEVSTVSHIRTMLIFFGLEPPNFLMPSY
jgi:predicted nuclease with TOPRIM domain